MQQAAGDRFTTWMLDHEEAFVGPNRIYASL